MSAARFREAATRLREDDSGVVSTIALPLARWMDQLARWNEIHGQIPMPGGSTALADAILGNQEICNDSRRDR